MAAEAVELSRMNRENMAHPDFQRLHSEESAAIRRPGIKKSISWGNRSDYARSISQQRKSVSCFKSVHQAHYYSTIAPFYHIRAKERAKYATLLHCRTGQKYRLKRSDKMAAQNEWRNGGIINPLFDGLMYNMSEHFAHCLYF